MRETVEFLSAHTLGKEEDATDYSFKTESQETDCAQSANSNVRILESRANRLISQKNVGGRG